MTRGLEGVKCNDVLLEDAAFYFTFIRKNNKLTFYFLWKVTSERGKVIKNETKTDS